MNGKNTRVHVIIRFHPLIYFHYVPTKQIQSEGTSASAELCVLQLRVSPDLILPKIPWAVSFSLLWPSSLLFVCARCSQGTHKWININSRVASRRMMTMTLFRVSLLSFRREKKNQRQCLVSQQNVIEELRAPAVQKYRILEGTCCSVQRDNPPKKCAGGKILH